MIFIKENETKNLCGIYKITQKSTNRVYIGQTKMKFKKRYWHHVWKLNDGTHDNKFLQNAWNKYGEADFEFEVVEILNKDEDMNQKEIYYINKFNTFHNGFNMTSGGEGKKDCPMSDEAKLVVGNKNKHHMLGKKHSEETKRKMRFSSPRRKLTNELKDKLINSRLGSKHSKSAKQKMREAKLGVGKVINQSLAIEIKTRLVKGETIKDISDRLNVDYAIVKSILLEKAWVHIIVDDWDAFMKEYKKRKKTLITDDQVRKIRELLAEGYTSPEISNLLNIGVSVIYGIKQNRTYKNVK